MVSGTRLGNKEVVYQVHYFVAELTKEDDVEKLSKFATETCSGLNVLVRLVEGLGGAYVHQWIFSRSTTPACWSWARSRTRP